MKRVRPISLAVASLLCATTTFAGTWTDLGVPTRVDLVANQGLMVYGAFGNTSSCTVPDRFFIPATHPQYKEIYAALLTAMSTEKQVEAYIDNCAPVNWYSVPSTTYSWMSTSGAVNIHGGA